MAGNNSYLFLTLRVFSATGGIEKVCRVFGKVLGEISKNAGNVRIYSMYDRQEDELHEYFGDTVFKGYGKAGKMRFAMASLRTAFSSGTIILSHVNLLSVGVLIRLLFRKKKLVLFAHGIEVWGNQGFLRRWMFRKCDLILAVSNFTRNSLIQNCTKLEKKVVVFNNCIDPFLPPASAQTKDETLLHRYGFNAADKIILTLTRLSSKELYKGYDNVLYAVSRLCEKITDLKYLIVGRYDEAEKWRLDNLIAEYGIGNRVVFAGYIPDSELAAHYQLADVYVMPSKKEGFGIVFIEAMHYGLPVIAGNKDGSADALCNGKLGLLVDCDNQAEIENAIEKVILNREQYKPDAVLLNQLFSFNSYREKCTSILALN